MSSDEFGIQQSLGELRGALRSRIARVGRILFGLLDGLVELCLGVVGLSIDNRDRRNARITQDELLGRVNGHGNGKLAVLARARTVGVALGANGNRLVRLTIGKVHLLGIRIKIALDRRAGFEIDGHVKRTLRATGTRDAQLIGAFLVHGDRGLVKIQHAYLAIVEDGCGIDAHGVAIAAGLCLNLNHMLGVGQSARGVKCRLGAARGAFGAYRLYELAVDIHVHVTVARILGADD